MKLHDLNILFCQR